jgi:hypothetical protein
MATIQDQIAQARAAGYDDAAIAAHLSSTPDLGPKMKTALDAGYKPADILSHLTGERAAPVAPTAPSEIPKGRSVGGFVSNVGTSAGNLVGGLAFTGLTLYSTHYKTAPKRDLLNTSSYSTNKKAA